MTVTIELPEIHQDIILDEHRYKVIKAGRGFAKSGILLAEAILDLTVEYKHPTGQHAHNRIVYGAPTYKEGREIIWERAKETLEPFIDGKPNESRLEIPLINNGLFIIKGCDKPDSLRGPYMTKFLGDEFAFHKEGYLMKIVRPMLGKIRPFGRATLASTPDGFNEFETFFQRGQSNDPDWMSWKYTSIEGGFMDPQEVEDGKKDMTYEQWRQEYWADTLMPTNSVYYAFDPEKHCRAVKFVEDLEICWFWDFNINPCVHSGLAHIYKGKVYQFDEICTGETPDTVHEFMDRYPASKVKAISIYGDFTGSISTTGTTDYQIMEQILVRNGYPKPEIKVYGGNPVVRDRTNAVNAKMLNANGQVGYYVNKEKCPKTVRDLLNVRRSDKTGGIDKTSKPELTHISDGLGYFIYTEFPPQWVKQPKVKPEKVKVVNGFGYWVD